MRLDHERAELCYARALLVSQGRACLKTLYNFDRSVTIEMKPEDRENWLYANGTENRIDVEEQEMLSILPENMSGRILDIGCGVGTVTLEIQKRGYEVIGLDFSSVAVEKARSRGLNVQPCDLDTGIPFPDESFNVVWAGDIVEHVFDPIGLLEEVRRVLRTDGRLLVTIPNDMRLRRRLSIFVRGTSPQSGVYRRFRQCKHHTVFSWELLQHMLNEAGLQHRYVGGIMLRPGAGSKRVSKSLRFGRWFAHTFIIEAWKKT